jgi:polysaccharide export outer membrane protein
VIELLFLRAFNPLTSMRYWILLAFIVFASSCTINKNVMFRTDQDYTFDTLSDSVDAEYKISPNDVITFQLFTNDGAKLLEFTTGSSEEQRFLDFGDNKYVILPDGQVELPEIGLTKLSGLTVYEAQDALEKAYKPLYNRPYAVVAVTNNRVIVFPGSGGDATVIPLTNQNTSVIEALAFAGGIANRGNASKVKLIRRVDTKQEVYLMDLSTIEGIRYAGMTVQANDIIYVEPVPEIAGEVLKDVAPFVSLISGLALIYAIITSNP